MRKVERQLLTLVSLGVHAQAVLRREREHAGIVLLAAKGPEGALAGVDKVPAALNLAPVPRRAEPASVLEVIRVGRGPHEKLSTTSSSMHFTPEKVPV